MRLSKVAALALAVGATGSMSVSLALAASNCSASVTLADAPACLVLAQETKISVDMIGIGGMSCAYWRSTQEHRLEGGIWIYGFWTGLNYVAAASGQPPAKINMSAIVVEVEKTCAQQTSQTLASAVWTTYLGSKK
jgi:hypothetical protein